MKRRPFEVIALVATFAAATPVSAKTILHPGSAPSIQDAIALSAAGDTVLVAPGRYAEKFHLKNGVVVRAAAARDSTVLVSPGGAPELMLERLVECGADVDSTTVLEGFTLEDGNFSGAGVYCEGGSPTVRGNVFRGFGWGLNLRNSRAFIEDNVIEKSKAFGILVFASSPTIIRNEIRENGGSALEISGKESRPIVGGSKENANRIYGNVISLSNASRNDIDATWNDWGWETTEEMKREGYPSDIIVIVDGNDFGKTHRGRGTVDYRNWRTPDAVAAKSPAPVNEASSGQASPPVDANGSVAESTSPRPGRSIPAWAPITGAALLIGVFVAAARRRNR